MHTTSANTRVSTREQNLDLPGVFHCLSRVTQFLESEVAQARVVKRTGGSWYS